MTNEILELCRLSSLRINNRSRMRLPPNKPRSTSSVEAALVRPHQARCPRFCLCLLSRTRQFHIEKCFLVFAFVVFICLILRRASPLLSQCNACLPFPIFHGRYNRIGIRVICSTFFHTEGCTYWQKERIGDDTTNSRHHRGRHDESSHCAHARGTNLLTAACCAEEPGPWPAGSLGCLRCSARCTWRFHMGLVRGRRIEGAHAHVCRREYTRGTGVHAVLRHLEVAAFERIMALARAPRARPVGVGCTHCGSRAGADPAKI